MKKKRNLKPVKLDPKFQKKLGILSIEPKIKRNPIIAQSGTYNGMKHETLGKDIEGWLEKPDIIVDSYTDMENIASAVHSDPRISVVSPFALRNRKVNHPGKIAVVTDVSNALLPQS